MLSSIILIVIIYSIDLSNSGGDYFCALHADATRDRSELFFTTLDEVQKTCIDEMSAFAISSWDLPQLNFTNELMTIQTDCAGNISDIFKIYYYDLTKILNDGNDEGSDEDFLNFLSGAVDMNQYPIMCISDDLSAAISLISNCDKQLMAAIQLHLSEHNTVTARSSSDDDD